MLFWPCQGAFKVSVTLSLSFDYFSMSLAIVQQFFIAFGCFQSFWANSSQFKPVCSKLNQIQLFRVSSQTFPTISSYRLNPKHNFHQFFLKKKIKKRKSKAFLGQLKTKSPTALRFTSGAIVIDSTFSQLVRTNNFENKTKHVISLSDIRTYALPWLHHLVQKENRFSRVKLTVFSCVS